MKEMITKTFEITATPNVMKRFERFLCSFHYNGGHSGTFAMPFDGDGSDVLKVSPAPPKETKSNSDFHIVANAGQSVEVACDDFYRTVPVDREKGWYRARNGNYTYVDKHGNEALLQEYDQHIDYGENE